MLGSGAGIVIGSLVMAILVALVVYIVAERRRSATGRKSPNLWVRLGSILAPPLVALAVWGFPITFEWPELRGFNFVGGDRIIPEFAALVVALIIYTASFIAEIVRAGLLAVPRGQVEAAYSLGLRPAPTLRLIVAPQALRVIIPPLTSQYLNLTKNSSLAVAIGYPDFFAVFAGTTLNQTGQAIEIVAITMGVYLAISLVTSLLMNWYNARVGAVER
jgi:general L-amino acid transport system permease protein